jgi:hypothetical protein
MYHALVYTHAHVIMEANSYNLTAYKLEKQESQCFKSKYEDL